MLNRHGQGCQQLGRTRTHPPTQTDTHTHPQRDSIHRAKQRPIRDAMEVACQHKIKAWQGFALFYVV